MGPSDSRYSDLRVLLFLCDKHLSKPFALIRDALDIGEISFYALEALFRPGIKLVAKDLLGQWQMFMCVEARLDSDSDYSGSEPYGTKCRILAWYLAWDPSFTRFDRRLIEFFILKFRGVRKINALPVYPLTYHEDESSRIALEELLMQRGRRWQQIMSDKPSCWMHEGVAIGIKETGYHGEGEKAKCLPAVDVRHPLFLISTISPTNHDI